LYILIVTVFDMRQEGERFWTECFQDRLSYRI